MHARSVSSNTTNGDQLAIGERLPRHHLTGVKMDFDQTITEATQRLERKQKLIQRAERRYEREAFDNWLYFVKRKADAAGIEVPAPSDIARLKRLAEMFEGAFSASQAVRRGWCGIRSAKEATKTLERFVGAGWLHSALPNREGHARYSFSQEQALGETGAHLWPEQMDGGAALVAADLLSVGHDGRATLNCETCAVPTQDAEGDIWAVARKLAFEEGTVLHKIAGELKGLSPVQQAYAMAIAQDRIVSSDPVKTHIRGIAEYLSVDYNAFRVAVHAAISAILRLGEIEKSEVGGQCRN